VQVGQIVPGTLDDVMIAEHSLERFELVVGERRPSIGAVARRLPSKAAIELLPGGCVRFRRVWMADPFASSACSIAVRRRSKAGSSIARWESARPSSLMPTPRPQGPRQRAGRCLRSGERQPSELSSSASPALGQLADATRLDLHDGFTNPTETRPAPHEVPPPPAASWTERFKQSGKPAEHTLMDQVWLSPALAPKQTGVFIDRRTRLGGDGSDHDPAWVTLSI
jgi:hypothetical protein